MSRVPRGGTGSFWSEGVGDRGLGPGRKLWALSEWPSLAWGKPQVEHGDCWTLAWGCPLPGPQGSIQDRALERQRPHLFQSLQILSLRKI